MVKLNLNTNPLFTYLLLGLLSFYAISCDVGKDYVRPEQKETIEFKQEFPKDSAITNIMWWDLFQDSVLVNLIDTALVHNKDILISTTRIQQALLAIDISRADLYPTINYGISSSSKGSSSTGQFANSVAPFVGASYTFDFWHKVRNMNAIALQNYLATEEAYKALQIGLISGIAQAYISLRDIDNRLLIAEKTAKNFQDNLNIMQAKFNGGIISEVDLFQSKIQLSEVKTTIEVFLRARGQLENTINILLGATPQTIPRGLPLYDQIVLPEIPVGIPSELLERRPDILIAESNLHAQTLRIGVAEALKYPNLTISANLGAELINPSLLFADFGAQILGPLFNSKKLRKNVELEELETKKLIYNYEYAFLNAVKEVEDAMIATNTYKKEFDLRNHQMEMATKASQLSWVRYDGGLTSYLEVLTLQSSQFSSELKASEAFKQQMISIVQLYEALGGGWIPETKNTETTN